METQWQAGESNSLWKVSPRIQAASTVSSCLVYCSLFQGVRVYLSAVPFVSQSIPEMGAKCIPCNPLFKWELLLPHLLWPGPPRPIFLFRFYFFIFVWWFNCWAMATRVKYSSARDFNWPPKGNNKGPQWQPMGQKTEQHNLWKHFCSVLHHLFQTWCDANWVAFPFPVSGSQVGSGLSGVQCSY